MDVVSSWWRYADFAMLLPCLILGAVFAVVTYLVVNKYTPRRLPMWWKRLVARLSRSRPVAVGIEETRRAAADVLTSLADSLASADPAAVDRDLYERAGLARSTAERYLESDHMTDVVGALVLARCGIDDLRLADGSGLLRFQPCFFNPLHDVAYETVGFEVGKGQVDVPACRHCRNAVLSRGRKVDALPSDTVLGRPYFEDDSPWALTGFGALVEDLPTALFRLQPFGGGMR